MKLRFTKMHGLGNDFVVIDTTRAPVELTPARVKAIADRHFGVGCDQLLVVEPASRPDVDFRYRIFNADGGEVEQCGNGARCFVRFVHDKGLSAKGEIRVETRSGVIAPRLRADGLVTVDMGVPELTPAKVPFVSDSDAVVQPLQVGGATVDYYAATRATIGLQIGAQQYAHALFFMTQPALEEFRRSKGWAASADLKYATPEEGASIGKATTEMDPVVALVFGQQGLIAGATLAGVKYTRIIP